MCKSACAHVSGTCLGAGSSARPFEELLSDHASLPTPESQRAPPIPIWDRPGNARGGLVWESSGPAHWLSLTGRCHAVCSDCELGGMSRSRGSPSLPGYAGLGPGALGRGKEPQKRHPNVLGTALGRGSLCHLDAWEPSPPGFLPRFPVGMVGPGPGRQGLQQSSGQCGRLVWALRQGPWGPGRFWARPPLLQAPVFPSAITMFRTPLLNPRVPLNLHCTEGHASL